MKTALITIDENASVFEAAEKMAGNGIGSLLVTKNGKITSIVTDTDLVKKSLAKRNTGIKVGEAATKPLVSVSPDDDLSKAAQVMGTRKIHRLAVSKAGKIVGVLSSTDIIRISPSLYDLIAQKQALQQARVRPGE